MARCTTCNTGVTSLGCAASSKRSGIGSRDWQTSTHWRTGTWGMTWSTRCAAVCAMRRAPHDGLQASALAAERDQLVLAAVGAAQAQETVRQDAALKKGLELVLHELRQAGARGGVDLGEEGRGVLLHQAVK